ncbi:antibiotic biosynthesis monooxygenase [Aliiglaciecola sp. M165]|nr:antibiotic biosynthesis monooxygenase [Aliiglaciecola sp. M165]
MLMTYTPPYYAVIFTSKRSNVDDGYGSISELMASLAAQQPGYLGIESAREDIGITVSYWRDLESIKAWKQNNEHLAAQKAGREKWYERYIVRIAKVEKHYEF